MTNPFIRKLENFTRFSLADRKALSDATAQNLRRLGAREDIINEGDEPRAVNLVLEGWACRYKQLQDGRRQIIAFFLPGDLCDPHIFTLRRMDHAVASLTPVTLARITQETIEGMTAASPRIAETLWWEMLHNAAVQREWTVSLGQRSAVERLAHLLCELYLRLRAVGLTEGTAYDLPVTQADLADTLGLSSVHVNRTLQELRGAGQITWKGRRVTIHDLPALMALALFDPGYLHLDHEGAHLDAN
ncbi:Crp/Fnr family transcriptional regulator [Methylobacterium sp. E-041]|uniref:Crp/Fnr family transcriptional regulator n=1 Tax=unclassified Methylobacterium TaxID=2615210 RepID=UPI0011C98934|nr:MULTISPECIES: Crp/Fnr family transcriptional regulator [unclassified Methylobacterium]MCJ2105716.1 Crp/Fnr family transcriptional regulator [Methylobacterium sp. E-041]MCJ2109673.1 Crp/Fnr family transcriptional regulator [Methylobacterium sp. E-025]TXM94573.1 Crp/Fnr family transcriptional regulator [Methylobacterium sp. WL116]TXN38763.1 Crp/Fnr family transcriptional regulator [Methylobacterium sp. WL93]TXN46999.1 Crp/Fnr family transcriptional regulator [Methylobacterium sp. WL119]